MITLSEEYAARLLEEDLGLLDVTTAAMGIGERLGRIECAPKEDCVVAGVELAASVLEKAGAKVHVLAPSGTVLSARTPCLEARGSARQLHGAYKVAQNVMEYASGIATRTAEMLRNARSVAPAISLCVTRKHFPGGKALSLSAAMAGGAVPHRLGLSDSILAFDEHRLFLRPGEPLADVVSAMAGRFPEKKIAMEANSPEEVVAFARAGVHVIQCERFEPSLLAECVVALRGLSPSIVVAAAGGVNAANAAEYARTGVDILVTSWPYFGRPKDIKVHFLAE